MPLHVPVAVEHSFKAEHVDITPPTDEILQSESSPLVPVPQNVRTTFYTKEITVPEGQTEVFLVAYTKLDPSAPVAVRTAYIAVDGVDIASASRDDVYWLAVAGWTTLTPGTHTVTIDMLQDQAGKSAYLDSDKALGMVCREPDSKYVSFSDTDVRTVLERAKKVKVIVGVRGLSWGDGVQDCEGYVKTTDKFGNEVEAEIFGDCPINPVLHEFAFVDTINLEVYAYDEHVAFWISYLNIIYEV